MKTSFLQRSLLLPTLALIALTSASSVQGFVPVGHTWGTSTVRYYVNPNNMFVSEQAAISAIQTAASVWNQQSRANVELVYAGTTGGASLAMNYKNEVFFRNDSNGTGNVGEAWYWWDGTGRLVDADIVFYAVHPLFAFSGCSNGVYIENAAVHEFGHALGLWHSEVPGATMQPAMTSFCDSSYLTLEADDIAGIETLYPPTGGGVTPAPNSAPSVSIQSPENNSSYQDGARIIFAGSASDSQDGNVTGYLRWTSNLLGQIGVGGSFSGALPVGVHVITATVTDSGGMSVSTQVTVSVVASVPTPPPPPPAEPIPAPSGGATLTARGYKVKGKQTADLSWSGLTSQSVDVYRNGSRISTTANDGAMTDAINRNGNGRYTYRVCAAGTSTCTNDANVVFQ
jgi:hypothetical protein